MDFELNIGTLSNTIKEYYNGLKSISEQKEIINNTVSNLYDSGWSGEARDKFATYHSQLQQKYNELEEDIEYIKNVLESYEKSQAALLKRRCEGFVECVALGGVSVEGTSDDEGKISLDFLGLTNMREMIDRSNIERYNKMNTILSEISQVVSNFSYTSFNLDYDIEECETSIGNQTMRLRNFDESLGLYYQEVKEIESNVLSQFGKISGKTEDIAPLVSEWSVLADDEVDKNNLQDILLKKLEEIKNKVYETIEEIIKNNNGLAFLKYLNYDSIILSSILQNICKIKNSDNEYINLTDDENLKGKEISITDLINVMSKNPEELTDEENQYLKNARNALGDWKYDMIKIITGNSDDDLMTQMNNTLTWLNKSSVIATNTWATITNPQRWKEIQWLSDICMPTTATETNAVKILESPVAKYVGNIGGKAGIIGTIITPIVEYNNSFKPYEDDLAACAEVDPENYNKYNVIAHIGAGADAASFGFGRSILNTIPSVYELTIGRTDWTEGWINNVNGYVNSRSAIEKLDDTLKDSTIGPKINQFLR